MKNVALPTLAILALGVGLAAAQQNSPQLQPTKPITKVEKEKMVVKITTPAEPPYHQSAAKVCPFDTPKACVNWARERMKKARAHKPNADIWRNNAKWCRPILSNLPTGITISGMGDKQGVPLHSVKADELGWEREGNHYSGVVCVGVAALEANSSGFGVCPAERGKKKCHRVGPGTTRMWIDFGTILQPMQVHLRRQERQAHGQPNWQR